MSDKIRKSLDGFGALRDFSLSNLAGNNGGIFAESFRGW